MQATSAIALTISNNKVLDAQDAFYQLSSANVVLCWSKTLNTAGLIKHSVKPVFLSKAWYLVSYHLLYRFCGKDFCGKTTVLANKAWFLPWRGIWCIISIWLLWAKSWSRHQRSCQCCVAWCHNHQQTRSRWWYLWILSFSLEPFLIGWKLAKTCIWCRCVLSSLWKYLWTMPKI